MPALPTEGSRGARRAPPPGLLWLVVLILVSSSAAAAPDQNDPRDAFSLIARALRASRRQTFTGRQEIVFSEVKGSGWTRVVADIARSGRRCRMTYRFPASVADMLVADDGRYLREFHPNCGLYLIRRAPAPEETAGAGPLSLLRRNYRCRYRAPQTIQGRQCDVVALTPRFGSGPSRLCWIDRATRTILRTEKYDCRGRRQYVSSFTEIRFAPRLPAHWFSPPPPPGITVQTAPAPPGDLTFAQARALSAVGGRAPCWSPPGYQRLRCASLPRPRGARALFLRYGDGLETISVYEETATPDLPPLTLQQRMLDNQLGRYGEQAWVQDLEGLRVTVVGGGTLPPSLGSEMMRALDRDTEQRLERSLTRDFGVSGETQGLVLRRRGWGYDQIAARLLARGSPARREQQARAWLTAALR